VIDEVRIVKDLEGSGYDLIMTQSRIIFGEPEENHEIVILPPVSD
jgi:hypothetical protein